MTNTRFSQREFLKKDRWYDNTYFTRAEQLEDACWNGLLDEVLPDILEKSSSGKNLHLREIRHAKSFLEIELCEYPLTIEHESSIDPYVFLPTTVYN